MIQVVGVKTGTGCTRRDVGSVRLGDKTSDGESGIRPTRHLGSCSSFWVVEKKAIR